MKERVISLFDVSALMVMPWAAAGHHCATVDIEPARHLHGKSLLSIQADIKTWRPTEKYEVVFGFPPCTDLANSGSRWWAGKAEINPDFQTEALALFRRTFEIADQVGARFVIAENPMGRISTLWRKPDYKFDPCDFGGYEGGQNDGYKKRTGLWVAGDFKMPKPRPITAEEKSRIHWCPPGPDRAYIRSLTPRGFARAVYEANC